MAGSENQRHHYETILNDYNVHYFDKWSTKYREEFIYEPLWRGLDFAGKRVADLACGSGFNSEALLKRFPTVVLSGYDISPSGHGDCNAKCLLLTQSGHGFRPDTRPLPDYCCRLV